MIIDSARAVIHPELGFAPPVARGLICLSCSVGILAHAWEQMDQGSGKKGAKIPASWVDIYRLKLIVPKLVSFFIELDMVDPQIESADQLHAS